MRNLSDSNGRALEYIIVKEIEQKSPQNQIQLTPHAIQAQQKDKQKYLSLPRKNQLIYKRCAERIYMWLEEEFSISSESLIVDRLSDKHGREGDVTDIRILGSLLQINLSVKHNHKALKHQRPASTAQHCGFPKKTPEDRKFREEYKAIVGSFQVIAQNSLNFRDLEEGVVFTHLYRPICDLVAQSINQLCQSSTNANHLLNFLLGRTDFYKIILDAKLNELHIQFFNKPSNISSVFAESHENYVKLTFDRLWKISMRLHTASSRIALSPSLKFDTQLDDSSIIPEVRLSIQ
jgi:hypothetical protein